MKRMLAWSIYAIIVCAIAIVVLRLLFPVPTVAGRPIESAVGFAPDSHLAQRLAADYAAHPGKSGVVELPEGTDALSARLHLIANASSSIDAQYYIWQDDTSGRMVFKAMLAAADRGVRVRLLLDDNGVPGLDHILASLNAHQNIAVRLFNPSTVRTPKIAGYIFDFFRMNRRMHNKALIVDGAATVIGGRNIGDTYFQVGDNDFYIDLDALAVGDVVKDVTAQFDAYWNSASAIDAAAVLTASPGDAAAQLVEPGESISPAAERDALARYEAFRAELESAPESKLEWTNIQVIYDDPIKGQGKATREQLMVSRFSHVTGRIERHIELVSAYFVPGKQGADFLAGLARQGIKVRVLTNSAHANDVLLVHTGYLKYRKQLLQAGVQLFELKRIGPPRHRDMNLDLDLKDLAGSSHASLHAKSFSVDGKRAFIGSFNFDPRSALLNCEMGMLIESPRMAAAMTRSFDEMVPLGSYRPELRDRDLVWVEIEEGKPEVVLTEEPHTSAFQRFVLRAISYLPIEWLL